MLACLIAILAYVIHFMSVVGIGTPVYIKNVYVDGLSFAGSTKEEGLERARALEDEWRTETFTFTYLTQSWDFTRASIDADINYEQQLELAWNFGHIGNAFERKRVIDAVAKNPVYLRCDVTYDESKLNAFIDQICAAIDVEAVDALVVPDVDAPVVIQESKTGLKVDREQLTHQLVTLITSSESDTSIPVETVFPEKHLDSVGFQKIAEFSTDVSFRNSASRSNVRIALDAFNGLTVMPGERYSFNDVVGPRTEANGFKLATEYAGDTTTLDYGGGVCQASTTLYNALTTAGMTILDRNQHTMTVSYVDPSRDAAVAYGSKDLVFQNDTEHPVYIYTSVNKELATVTIYGHQPEYFYQLETVMIEKNVASARKLTIEDTDGTHVYFKDDPPVLQSEGKPGCISQGWVVAYDWNTHQEVSRVQVSQDNYRAGASVYYVGVHDRNVATDLVPTY